MAKGWIKEDQGPQVLVVNQGRREKSKKQVLEMNQGCIEVRRTQKGKGGRHVTCGCHHTPQPLAGRAAVTSTVPAA